MQVWAVRHEDAINIPVHAPALLLSRSLPVPGPHISLHEGGPTSLRIEGTPHPPPTAPYFHLPRATSPQLFRIQGLRRVSSQGVTLVNPFGSGATGKTLQGKLPQRLTLQKSRTTSHFQPESQGLMLLFTDIKSLWAWPPGPHLLLSTLRPHVAKAGGGNPGQSCLAEAP